SKPYYDFFLHSFGLPLLLLMGIGPLVAWRRASLRALGKTFLVPSAAAVAIGSLVRLVGRNRRRYGGYVVHAAVVMLAIGIAGSSAYQTIRERTLSPGQSMTIAGYTLTYRELTAVQGANYKGFRAQLDVTRGGSHVATVDPGENNYAIEGPANEASVYHDPRTLGDVFTIAQIDKGDVI